MRQCRPQIGKPVEKLPHILMHLIETLLREKSRALHLLQTQEGGLHPSRCNILLHARKSALK